MRHNALVKRLAIAALNARRIPAGEQNGLELLFDPFRGCNVMLPKGARLLLSLSIPGCERGDLKPNFVLLDKTAKNALVIDVTLPFDGPQGSIEAARNSKLEKYSTLAPELKRLTYDRVTVDALVVGSLGYLDPDNARVFSALRLSRRAGKLMA